MSPSAGLDRCWASWLKAVERRNWEDASEFMATDFRDSWGQSREQNLQLARRACSDFIILDIERESVEVHWHADGSATARAVIRLSGQGGPLAQELIRGSHGFDEPTEFSWRRPDWRPWHWELTGVSNAAADPHIRRLQREYDQLGLP